MKASVPPKRRADFVGQDHLLEEVIPQTLRSAAGRRPVILRGVLGSGASSVAAEYWHRTLGRYYDVAEWIDCEDDREVGIVVGRALSRFRESGGPALLVLDGAAQPQRLSEMLPSGGPDILITSSVDAAMWRGVECVLTIAPLTAHDAVRLLRRYEPGLSTAEAEQLAARLDHSPEVIAHVGKMLSRKLSVRQVREMPNAELLELLRRGANSPADRIDAAVEAVGPEWLYAQDLLRALALIGSRVFPTRHLGRVDHRPLLLEAFAMLSRRGLLHFGDDGTVTLPNLTRLISLPAADSPARARADRLAETLLTALDIDGDEPAHRAAAEQVARHMLVLEPERITTADGRLAMIDLCRVHLRDHHHHLAVGRLWHLRRAWGGGTAAPWEVLADRHLARAYEGIGHVRSAFDCAVRVMEDAARRRGPYDRQTLSDSHEVTRLLGLRDPAAASVVAENLERLESEWLGEQAPETLRTGSLLARLRLDLGRPDTAADTARRVWRAQSDVLTKSDPETLATLHLLGQALEATGYSAREALICYREASRLRRRALGRDHADTTASREAYLRVRTSLTRD